MESLTIIEGETLKQLERRLISVELNLQSILKLIQQKPNNKPQNCLQDFITIEEAAKKYNTPKTTMFAKINLYKKTLFTKLLS